ncbi:hypothetical protein VTO42DRAFT_1581 [Malbranchea cinnamomea]
MAEERAPQSPSPATPHPPRRSSARGSFVPRLDTGNFGRSPNDASGHTRSPALSPRVAEELPTEPARSKNLGRHALPSNRDPKWHKEYSEIDHLAGRVLVIDYIKQDASKTSIRKVAAQEIYDLQGLHKLYDNLQRKDEAILRVFHVQNADWATHFLLRKFNIENRNDFVGRDFGKFARRSRPEWRGRRPFLTGKTWKVQHDPWRGISKTCFGFDYLKHFPAAPIPAKPGDDERFMELNCFDEEESPEHGYDIYGQRFSCYIQSKRDFPDLPDRNSFMGEGTIDDSPDKTRDDAPLRADNHDNGNAILIFDNAHDNSIESTLITARGEWEKRWRRLPFFLAFESRDFVATDEELAFQCSRIILEDIFRALSKQWYDFLDLAMNHISILEDKLYDQPADEARAPELWYNSSRWLKVERLVYLHLDIVNELRPRLEELTDIIESEEMWLSSTSADIEQHCNIVSEDLVKPIENLISLLYQSISIRDSRHNIRLSLSMWRLSWITFIFLPLTFITGFFGMNVDTFASDPSIKYYFISAIPFMVAVLLAWYVLKHLLRFRTQVLPKKGIYETFYNEMANSNPLLWSRYGPRDYIAPKGRIDRIKWNLIKRWAAPERTIKPEIEKNDAVDPANDLGTFNKFRRYLIRRWTAQIESAAKKDKTMSLEDGGLADHIAADNRSVVAEGLAEATEVMVIPATPAAEPIFDHDAPPQVPQSGYFSHKPHQNGNLLSRKLSFQSHHRRSSSGNRTSDVLVEEEDWQWLSQRGKQGKKWIWRSSSSRARSEEEKGSEGGKEVTPSVATKSTAEINDRGVQKDLGDRPQSEPNHTGKTVD